MSSRRGKAGNRSGTRRRKGDGTVHPRVYSAGGRKGEISETLGFRDVILDKPEMRGMRNIFDFSDEIRVEEIPGEIERLMKVARDEYGHDKALYDTASRMIASWAISVETPKGSEDEDARRAALYEINTLRDEMSAEVAETGRFDWQEWVNDEGESKLKWIRPVKVTARAVEPVGTPWESE